MKPLAGKRIVFVLGTFELGGAERQALLLARELGQQADARVEVWSFADAEGPVAAMCQRFDLPWRHEPFDCRPWRGWRRHWLAQLGRLAMALRRARPDVLMPYCALPNLACGLVWRATGATACVWNQRDEGLQMHPRFERLAARLTTCFIANSAGGARFLQETHRIRPDLIHTIANGVELAAPARDRAAWRAQLGVSHDQLVACMVANLHRQKDHATAIRAWRLVVDRFRQSDCLPTLLLAGNDVETGDSLRSLVEQLRLGDCVRFLGHVADVPGLLGCCDLSVFSSPREGCPNAVLEAMAASLPVVASDIDGVRIALGSASGSASGEQLVAAGDHRAMADRILAWAEDSEARQRAGSANRRRILAQFSPRQLVERTTDVLSTLLAVGGRRRAA
jgi:glycosyltransferase involved in cell wall biosynthesis